ncbi:MAG: hypothetical protein Q7R74_00150 [bacterium]|nr:hypothetical protein [bacterium]
MQAGVILAKESEVEKEARFETLNGRGFIRGDTPQHQWYLLVTEACEAASITVDEVVRDYLAVMLNRFMGRAEFFEQLAAFDFYQHALGIAKIDSPCVQDVADISLQYVAFFPERSQARHQPRSLEYVANVGTSLYQELARSSVGKDDWFSDAFRSMAKSFGRAVMVLRSTCPRFALQREMANEGVRRDGVPFHSLSEMIRLAPALNNFNRMYFQPEGPQGLKNN